MYKFKHSSAHRHRPLLCQACEQSPAAFLCKADDASLCAACDSDIHSANPLARRHHRIPIHPSMDGHNDFLMANHDDHRHQEADEEEAASWLLPNPHKKNNSSNNNSVEMLFGGVMDDYLDLDEYNTCQFGDQFGSAQGQQRCYNNNGTQKGCPGEDSVVPIQGNRGKCQVQDHGFHLGLEYDTSNVGYSSSTTTSISHNVSISSADVGIVPESATNEASMSHQRPPKGTIDLFTGCHVQMPNQLSAEDREARVLRYREKKKMRKFEKTIRYASRKAFAEIRPRIKGRFAKRTTDAGGVVGMEQMLSESGMSENAYGIVPTLF